MVGLLWLTENSGKLWLCLAENVDKNSICDIELDEAKVKQFKDAVESSYWFEFFMGMCSLLSSFFATGLMMDEWIGKCCKNLFLWVLKRKLESILCWKILNCLALEESASSLLRIHRQLQLNGFHSF